MKAREKERRFSKVREAVLQYLEKSAEPHTAIQIEKALAKVGLKVHKTTIYRELEILEKSGTIQYVYFDGKQVRYELTSKPHHHHVVCVDCGTVKDIAVGDILEKKEKAIAHKSKFTILRHSLEFFGICSRCKK